MMCCLLNGRPSCRSLMHSHRMVSASVGFFLFSLAYSFSKLYDEGSAVLNSKSRMRGIYSSPKGEARRGLMCLTNSATTKGWPLTWLNW